MIKAHIVFYSERWHVVMNECSPRLFYEAIVWCYDQNRKLGPLIEL